MKLYVGNLSFQTSSEDLQELFGQVGEVESATVVEDRDTGRARGFGFVEMASREEGAAAVALFNGRQVHGRKLDVNMMMTRGTRGRGYEPVSPKTPQKPLDLKADLGNEGDRIPDDIAAGIEKVLKTIAQTRTAAEKDWDEIQQLGAETRRLISRLQGT